MGEDIQTKNGALAQVGETIRRKTRGEWKSTDSIDFMPHAY